MKWRCCLRNAIVMIQNLTCCSKNSIFPSRIQSNSIEKPNKFIFFEIRTEIQKNTHQNINCVCSSSEQKIEFTKFHITATAIPYFIQHIMLNCTKITSFPFKSLMKTEDKCDEHHSKSDYFICVFVFIFLLRKS